MIYHGMTIRLFLFLSLETFLRPACPWNVEKVLSLSFQHILLDVTSSGPFLMTHRQSIGHYTQTIWARSNVYMPLDSLIYDANVRYKVKMWWGASFSFKLGSTKTGQNRRTGKMPKNTTFCPGRQEIVFIYWVQPDFSVNGHELLPCDFSTLQDVVKQRLMGSTGYKDLAAAAAFSAVVVYSVGWWALSSVEDQQFFAILSGTFVKTKKTSSTYVLDRATKTQHAGHGSG